jgi:hypothetical protein
LSIECTLDEVTGQQPFWLVSSVGLGKSFFATKDFSTKLNSDPKRPKILLEIDAEKLLLKRIESRNRRLWRKPDNENVSRN